MRGTKSNFMVTLDEALNFLHSTHEKRKISENCLVHEDKSFELFMIIDALTGRGTLPLIKSPPKSQN